VGFRIIQVLVWESFGVSHGKLRPVMSVLNNGSPAGNIDPQAAVASARDRIFQA